LPTGEIHAQVWMITGDKQETAINIAIACKLVHRPKDLLIINAAGSNEAARARLEDALQQCKEQRRGRAHHLPGEKAGLLQVPATH
jgi:magnesium-transporting ATPase (P-type)